MKKHLILKMTSVLALTTGLLGCSNQKNEFEPKLDKDAQVTLSTVGFFGNFEAFDAVCNDFNNYYPNVKFTYEQVSGDNFLAYIVANQKVDIFMNSAETFSKNKTLLDKISVDLSKSDVNLKDIDQNMLKASLLNNKLYAIPMGQSITGIVVNKTLLEKEGLSIPTNYKDFLKTLEQLKTKGYTPLQGPESKLYSDITSSMLYDMLLSDESLYNDLLKGDMSVVDKLLPIYDKLNTLIQNNYTDFAVNQTYPADNYDQAILKFFEGNVPFWVCNSEKVSGMKKRETKFQTFKDHPFEYDFIQIPLGNNGVYAYKEPWYSFSVNKNGSNKEYALEFIRLLTTKDEINKMADIKGIPSVALEKSDNSIYKTALNPSNTELDYINDGRISYRIQESWVNSVYKYVSGEYKSGKDALEFFVKRCSQ